MIAIFAKQRPLIYANALASALATLIVVLLAPKRYTAEALLMPSVDEGVAVLMGSVSGGQTAELLSALTGATLFSPSMLYQKLLESRPVRVRVADSLDLWRRYKAKNTDELMDRMDERIKVTVDKEGVIKVACTDEDPKAAASIANGLVAALDAYVKEQIKTRGRLIREFLEGRLREAQEGYEALLDSLSAFQEAHGAMGMPEELASAISSYSQLKAQLLLKEYVLEAKRSYASPGAPELVELEREVGALRAKISQMEREGVGGFGPGFGAGLREMPKLMAEYTSLYTKLQIEGQLLVLLTEEYEKARILEMRTTPSVQVLSPAVPPDKRSWPKRSLMVLASLFLGLVVGLGAGVVVRETERTWEGARPRLRALLATLAGDLAPWRRK